MQGKDMIQTAKFVGQRKESANLILIIARCFSQKGIKNRSVHYVDIRLMTQLTCLLCSQT